MTIIANNWNIAYKWYQIGFPTKNGKIRRSICEGPLIDLIIRKKANKGNFSTISLLLQGLSRLLSKYCQKNNDVNLVLKRVFH